MCVLLGTAAGSILAVTGIEWSDLKKQEKELHEFFPGWLEKGFGEKDSASEPFFPHCGRIGREFSGYIPNPASKTYPISPKDSQILMDSLVFV